MEEENLIPGAGALLNFIEACASGLDSLLQWLGNILPSFLTEEPGALVLTATLFISFVLWATLNVRFFTRDPETFFRMTLPWYDAALLLGMGAGYPVKMVTQESLGFFGWLYFENPRTRRSPGSTSGNGTASSSFVWCWSSSAPSSWGSCSSSARASGD